MDIILVLIALAITTFSQFYITSKYNKYSKVSNSRKISGFETARKILDKYELNNVYITETEGTLTDHYDPTKKVVKLSKSVFNDTTITSCAVAAHEVGHAIQDKQNYKFLKMRNSIVPLVNFSSYSGYIAITIGLIFNSMPILWIGIALEVVVLLFQLITLPVEFNASKRALQELEALDLVDKNENGYVKEVLTAAALTYVASVISTVTQILRLIITFGNSNKK